MLRKGSSPRVWGQVQIGGIIIISNGIIPTRVGTSYYQYRYPDRRKDHPHACGDKLILVKLLRIFLGSSPRVWGQVIPQINVTFNHGIIPTRVGTSFPSQAQIRDSWDHPHACGDKCLLPPNDCLCSGSSPRVWGQDRFGNPCTVNARIIPTRVGTRFEAR